MILWLVFGWFLVGFWLVFGWLPGGFLIQKPRLTLLYKETYARYDDLNANLI